MERKRFEVDLKKTSLVLLCDENSQIKSKRRDELDTCLWRENEDSSLRQHLTDYDGRLENSRKQVVIGRGLQSAALSPTAAAKPTVGA